MRSVAAFLGLLSLTACDVVSGLAGFGVGEPASGSVTATSGTGGSGPVSSSSTGATGGAGGGGGSGGEGGTPCANVVPCLQPTAPWWDDFSGGGLPEYGVVDFAEDLAIEEAMGELHIVLAQGASNAWGHIESPALDFTDCGAVVKQLSPPLGGGEVAYLFVSYDTANRVGFILNGPSLEFDAIVGGVETVTSVPYDVETQRWWWLRTGTTTATWYTSADQNCWVEQRSIPNPFSPLELASVRVWLGGGVTVQVDSEPRITAFDSLNVAP